MIGAVSSSVRHASYRQLTQLLVVIRGALRTRLCWLSPSIDRQGSWIASVNERSRPEKLFQITTCQAMRYPSGTGRDAVQCWLPRTPPLCHALKMGRPNRKRCNKFIKLPNEESMGKHNKMLPFRALCQAVSIDPYTFEMMVFDTLYVQHLWYIVHWTRCPRLTSRPDHLPLAIVCLSAPWPGVGRSMPRRAMALTGLSRLRTDEPDKTDVRRAPNVKSVEGQDNFSNCAWNCMDDAWSNSPCPRYVSQRVSYASDKLSTTVS